MIEHWLKPGGGRRRRFWRRRRVLAVFSFRYDAHLVPDLIASLTPMVDGWVAFDDRASAAPYTDERPRRRALVDRARDLGADWLLAVDPDERFEAGLAEAMPRLTATRRPTRWTFDFRELYAPDAYRVDGIWGEKRQARLFSMYPPADIAGPMLHGQWYPAGTPYRERHTGLNLYHLRMITPERRRARRDLYRALDPAGAFQPVGYDYLADDAGAVLQPIPPGRAYRPQHRDDGGLWAPAPAAVVASPPPGVAGTDGAP